MKSQIYKYLNLKTKNMSKKTITKSILCITSCLTALTLSVSAQTLRPDELNKKLYEQDIAKTKLHQQQALASTQQNYSSEKNISPIHTFSVTDTDDDGMPDT